MLKPLVIFYKIFSHILLSLQHCSLSLNMSVARGGRRGRGVEGRQEDDGDHEICE